MIEKRVCDRSVWSTRMTDRVRESHLMKSSLPNPSGPPTDDASCSDRGTRLPNGPSRSRTPAAQGMKKFCSAGRAVVSMTGPVMDDTPSTASPEPAAYPTCGFCLFSMMRVVLSPYPSSQPMLQTARLRSHRMADGSLIRLAKRDGMKFTSRDSRPKEASSKFLLPVEVNPLAG